MSEAPAVRLDLDGRIATITLDRPRRHNCLVPELLEALIAALDAARAATPDGLVLTAAGRSFSTGGDVAAFAALPRGVRRAYAGDLIGLLNQAILGLAAFPAPVVARLHGAVTGGSAGLIFASDIVVMAESAFIQPYYSVVGFAPDGGWTALLPERIGAARSGSLLYRNHRIGAREALALGLATEVVADADIDRAVSAEIAGLLAKEPGSLMATRALLWPPARLATLVQALEQERQAFLQIIETPAVEAGMQRFLDTIR